MTLFAKTFRPRLGPLLLLLLTARFADAQSLVAASARESSAGGAPGKAIGPAVLDYADEMPRYVGGEGAMLIFFQRHLTYSAAATAHLTSGIVYVSFVVDTVGRTINPQVIKGVGYGLDEEALRLVRIMPWWQPGKMAGRAVPVRCTMPIRFRIADGGT